MTPHCSTILTICFSVLTPFSLLHAQETNKEKEQVSEKVKSVLGLVNDYLETASVSGDERLEKRREMIKFSFRSTRENGRYRLMSEKAWEEWEEDRFKDRSVRRVKVIGDPIVEKRSNTLYRVSCAVHIEETVKGRAWEGINFNQYEVRLDGDAPQIVHEKVSAIREGISPGNWTEVGKKETSASRSNVRSSPTTKFNNVIAKVENGERVRVWDQKGQTWLLVRTPRDEIGFIHRTQLDFSSQLSSKTKTADRDRTGRRFFPFATVIPGKSGYVLNPYTQAIVDVRGMQAGTLVRDPEDNEKQEKFFRVPFTTAPPRAMIVEPEVASSE